MSSHRILNDFQRAFAPGGPGTAAQAEAIRDNLDAQKKSIRLDEVSNDTYLGNNQPSRVVTFIRPETGYVSGSYPSTSNCTVALATDQVRNGFSRTIKVVISGAVTATVDWAGGGPNPVYDAAGDPVASASRARIKFNKGLSEFSFPCYLENASNITFFEVEVTMKVGGGTGVWRGVVNDGSLVNGWNDIRRFASQGHSGSVMTGWDEADPEITRIRLIVVASGAATIHLEHIYGVERNKASLVLISDLSEKYFLNGTDLDGVPSGGLPDLTSRGLLCTLACLPGQWGTTAATPTVTDVRNAVASGHAVSLHSLTGENTSAMSADGMRNYAIKGIQEIKRNGFHFFPFRSAWFQNLGNMSGTPTLMDDLFYGMATWSANSVGYNAWPPVNRRNIGRYIMHNRPDSDADTLFARLENTREVCFAYTHYVTNNTGSTTNMVTARWAHFLSKIDEGIAGDWLEVVTPEILFRRAGGRLVTDNNRMWWEWREDDGSLRRILA